MRETQSPEKISRQPIITRIEDFTWRMYDREDLVGGYSQEMTGVKITC